jgi:hypothetical protein
VTEQEEPVRAIIDRLYYASGKMRKKNPHRLLMLQAMSALIQLTKRIEGLPDDDRRIIEIAH